MTRQASHLARLVDDLLDVSRITHGKIQLVRAPIDLAGVIDDAVNAIDGAIAKNQQRLTVTLPDELLLVDGDTSRLSQVVMNLLANAIKYSDRGGHIDLTVQVAERPAGRVAVLRVRDDGVGIAPEHISELFELFFQADTSLARSQGGLGIGLTMVRRLVELHGGRVTASSSGLGRGTEFLVELPLLSDTSVPMQTDPPASAVTESGGTRRIVLVDDNVDSAELFRMALELAGHEVSVAHDGQSGLQEILGDGVEIAVVDIGLPILDGYEVARRVRDARGPMSPYLIAVTGYGRPEDRAAAMAAGFNVHMVKPIDLDELHTVLASGASRPPREQTG